ncbi:hypothetical protein [Devosia sp.]|uniref:hypothetical protein n=1 Tax=Devosia sp. TaxID=1871048 RepID=UPI001ACADB18|nr:hypothetical protein [Devosia sp.]MBN9334686.1 hypothetical protein [Devosia sp.]
MAEIFPTRAAVEQQGQAVADGLRNIMLLIRQIRTGEYEVTTDGMGVIEGLIFMETTLLDDHLDQVKAVLAFTERLEAQTIRAVKEVEETDAEIAKLLGAARRCLQLLATTETPATASDILKLMERALASIEKRLALPEAPTPASNVVAFPGPSLTVLEGGAA